MAYVQPSRRPADGRFGENPNRLFQHHQFQVILKPAPKNVQELYLDSLKAIGIDPLEHDIRFVEDDWESPTLGAWGLGWEVWCDGMEITQFTYFQQCGGFECRPVSAELTYGLERICMYLQNVENVFDVEWVKGVKYREVFHANEVEMSTYAFQRVRPADALRLFDSYEKECKRLHRAGLPLPAYDYALSAPTPSTCSTRAARSRSPSAPASSSACATTPGSAPRATSRCASGSATRCCKTRVDGRRAARSCSRASRRPSTGRP